MHVLSISARNPGPLTGAGNNTYLVVWPDKGYRPASGWPDENAHGASLIDAGVGHPDHLEELAETLRAHDATLEEVLVTHAHSDHASGAPAIQARWPSAAFRKIPWPGRDAATIAWTPLEDGSPVANGALETVHTPGHAPDHAAFWDRRGRVLFSADLVIQGTTVVIPASHGGSLAEYLRSLGRVLDLDPERLLPAHGRAIDNPRALIEEYVAHRALRDDQVVNAVRSGRRTVDAIVDAVYPGLVDALKPFARESALAHLEKLTGDGRVRRLPDDTWE